MPTIETMLDALKQHGIELKPDMTEEQRTRFMMDVEEIDTDDPEVYIHLLNSMGTGFSDDVVALDLECIDSPDAYVAIAHQLIRLADGALPLEQIESVVDFDAETAALAFTLHGQRHEWALEFIDDWMDPSLFRRFNDLLAAAGSTKRFYSCFDIQAGPIVCADREQIDALERLTGVAFSNE